MRRVVIQPSDLAPCIAEVTRLHTLGRKVLVEVTTYRAARSLSQLRTQHMWYAEIAEETGHSSEEIKALLKDSFGPVLVIEVGGEERVVRKPSAQYTKAEAWEYMTRIQAWAAEMGFRITNPEPDEVRQWREDLERENADAAMVR